MKQIYGLIDGITGIFEKANGSFSEEKKVNLLAILMFIMMCVTIGVPVVLEENSFSTVVLLGMVISILMIGLTVKAGDIRFNSIKLTYLIPTLIFGLSFLGHGLMFKVVGYLAIGIVFTFIIPIFQIVSNKFGDLNLAKGISKGIVASFVAFILVSFLFGPKLTLDQYSAFTANPNIVGGYMIIVVAALLFLSLEYNKRGPLKYIYIFGLSMATTICFFSNARTALFAVIMELILGSLVYFIRKSHKETLGKTVLLSLKNFVIFILILAVSLGLFFFSMTIVKKEIAKVLPQIKVENQKDISLEDSLNVAEGRFGKGIEDGSHDSFTSGRMGIWQAYIKEIGLIGHPEESRKIVTTDRTYESTNAHNVYLQVAYSAGLVGGIAMVLIMLRAGISLLALFIRFLKGNDVSNGIVLFACSFVGYGIVSMTSAGYMVFTYLPVTLFWLTMSNVSTKKVD